jgi:zinc-ribbon domain
MTRYCANCGTEVDETAAFCPTCGQPIDQADEVGIPPAPAWPEPSPQDSPPPRAAEPTPPAQPGWTDEAVQRPAADQVRAEDPTRVEEAPPPPPPAAPTRPPPPDAGPERPAPPAVSLPITWPVTLSAWLIGIGALVGAVGALIGMFGGVLNPLDLLLFLLLIGIAVTVFFAASIPAFQHLRLATFVVVLIGFGMALDRIGFGGAGVGALLLFLGTAAAGMGCILLELGRDEPLGGPRT